MIENAKYIVYQLPDGTEDMIMFSSRLKHSDVAERLLADRFTVVSAGSIDIYKGKVKCFGESLSLGVSARPGRDQWIATKTFPELDLPDCRI